MEAVRSRSDGQSGGCDNGIYGGKDLWEKVCSEFGVK